MKPAPVTKPSHYAESVYTPWSELRQPGRLLANMWRDLLASRGLALRLMIRDISAHYRQSVFGFAWANRRGDSYERPIGAPT